MNALKEKAVIDAVFDLKSRVMRIEGLLEGLLANDTERVTLLRDLRAAVEHTRRLVNEKTALMAAVGEFALRRSHPLIAMSPSGEKVAVDGLDIADIERIAREIREAH
jgi:hypothetical protein